ncbi:uncharacterized protein LOC128678818 isoform X2 [Plodia interpunctella]|uniref:uncharacterized protein LOC128678818 isoform X2 n=1 Tax=Plodia interpunctella TaxID=58824 RepID=UPI0023680181|nr:uncharacterized protein LOC128678818 isoform X2 [Plodia interpunctella]
MGIAKELFAVILFIHFFISGTRAGVSDETAAKLMHFIKLLPSSNQVNGKLKVALANVLKESNSDIFKQSSDEYEFEQDLAKLKELDLALEEFIISNSHLLDTFHASLPDSGKSLKNALLNETEVNETDIMRDALIKNASASLADIHEQIQREEFADHVSFADLMKKSTIHNYIRENFVDSNSNDKQQTRMKRDDAVYKQIESNNANIMKVSFLNSTSKADVRSISDNGAAEKVINLLREEEADVDEDDNLEDIEEDEKPKKQSQSQFKKIPGRYILPLLRAKNMASNVVNTGYQSIKNATGSLVEALKKFG